MAKILRVKLRWSGFTGGPGYSIFHFRDFGGTDPDQSQAQAAVGRIDSFAEQIAGLMPNGASLKCENDVELLEDTTGMMETVFTVTPSGPFMGGQPAGTGYSAASGAVVNWRTGSIRKGRRVRGRTFLVPLSSLAYQSDGSLHSNAHNIISAAATALVAGTGTPDLGVYARPTIKGASDGAWYVATSATVPDMVAIMRSRRD